jgi:hypothetical protein|tara:strand:+ start:2879 stop:3100 length:222 start_codon:yes stop_codon:yes gene_type:complete
MIKTYQVGIYNKRIRDNIRNGDDVDPAEAAWEEVHYFDIKAESEEDARKKAQFEHKPEKGFVIDCVDAYEFGE